MPEHEIASLIAWADAVILPYREASQSGVAAAAIAARRWVVATRVGGLVEQFRGETGAILCGADPRELRRAIETLLAAPPPLPDAAADPRSTWSGEAARLLHGIRRDVMRCHDAPLPVLPDMEPAPLDRATAP